MTAPFKPLLQQYEEAAGSEAADKLRKEMADYIAERRKNAMFHFREFVADHVGEENAQTILGEEGKVKLP